MSKKNKNPGSATSTPSAGGTKAKRAVKPLLERLIGMADQIHALSCKLADVAAKRLPHEMISPTKAFIAVAEQFREPFYQLRDSGWTPPEKSAIQTFVEGDAVAIQPEVLSQYGYIPSIADPAALDLRVRAVLAQGKSTKILIGSGADLSGPAYGYVPKGHLVRR